MLRTNKQIRIENWRNYGPVVIPAGLKVSKMSGSGSAASTVYFLEDFDKVFDANTEVMQYHDAMYYGISLNAADVSEF